MDINLETTINSDQLDQIANQLQTLNETLMCVLGVIGASAALALMFVFVFIWTMGKIDSSWRD